MSSSNRRKTCSRTFKKDVYIGVRMPAEHRKRIEQHARNEKADVSPTLWKLAMERLEQIERSGAYHHA